MKLNFSSKHLDRTLDLGDLITLSEPELRELHCELSMAIDVMDDRIQVNLDEQKLTGRVADQDWLNRVRKKRRICAAFRTQVEDVIKTINTADRLYLRNLERLVAQELGPVVWNEIHQEALKAAAMDVARPAEAPAA